MHLSMPQRSAATLPPASCFDGWIIGGVIGRGATSTVYEATHRATGVPAAVKVLEIDTRRRSDIRLRHAREVEVLARIDSPHVPTLLDSGDTPAGSPYVVLERLEGETLEQVLERRIPSIPEVYRIARALLHAVAAVHRHGVVHRDLKPANVFLHRLPDGTRIVKVLDFGICLPSPDQRDHARLTRQDMFLGTASYVAPEQLRGEEADERSDLYSVGAILYECLTGQSPFPGDTWGEVAMAVLNENAPSPVVRRTDCPGSLARLVSIALTREPERRFRSAMEMIGALEDVRAGELPCHPEEHAELVGSSRPAGMGEALGWTPMVALAFALATLATLVTLLIL